jgi:hypothetical protein
VTERVIEALTQRGLLDVSLRESPIYVFPAKTDTGHIDTDSLKKQHAKAVLAVKAKKAGKHPDEINF